MQKKNITIVSSITIVFLIMSIVYQCYASALNVTKESLQTSFNEIFSNLSKKQINNEVPKEIKANVSDNIIKIISVAGTYDINYDLTAKPTFYIDCKITSDMTNEEANDKLSDYSILEFCLLAVAQQAGVSEEDAIAYVIGQMLSEMSGGNMTTGTTAITNQTALATAKQFEGATVNDKLFTMKFTKIGETSDEYDLREELIINNEEDFTIMNGSASKLFSNQVSGGTVQAVQNAINGIEKFNVMKNENNQELQQLNAVVGKLPQSGRTFDIEDLLNIMITISIISLIAMFIYDRKNK